MVGGVANVWVPVEDIDRALDFYRNALGFSVIKRDGLWAEVDANGLNIGLNYREPQGTPVEGGPVITFQPEAGLEAAVEELEDKGSSSQRRSQSTSGDASLRSRTARATTSSFMSRLALDAQLD
jgi:catechol 2,3-dioxygenase-like lactoylglutathione lyase family enzyme